MFINKTNGVSGYLRPKIQKIKKEKKAIYSESAVVFEKDRQSNKRNKEEDNYTENKSEEDANSEIEKGSDHINIFA